MFFPQTMNNNAVLFDYNCLWSVNTLLKDRKNLCNAIFFINLNNIGASGNISQKQPLEVFYKKEVRKNFIKFTGKHQ